MSNLNNTLEYICEKAKNPSAFVEECEKRYENIVTDIAKKLANSGKTEIIMLAGPSSSGKTTTAKKLREALSCEGVKSFTVSLDDFYLNNCDAPRFPDGTPDFETVYALDIECFEKTMNEILKTGTGHLPEFDFVLGERKKELNEIHITENDVIIVEGLHALNPVITQNLPAERLYKIYINASSRILDENNNVVLKKREIRLVRRIVRDYKFRGNSVEKTYGMWKSVCNGEGLYLFPYRNTADIKINTIFLYEDCVLKNEAIKLLSEVDENSQYFGESQMLLKNLCRFPSINKDFVPENSMLREFIGKKE